MGHHTGQFLRSGEQRKNYIWNPNETQYRRGVLKTKIFSFLFLGSQNARFARKHKGFLIYDLRFTIYDLCKALGSSYQMKRFLFCIPLLCLAPLGFFFGPYLSGLGALTFMDGMDIVPACAIICALIVSIVFATVVKSNWGVRFILFVATLIVQGALVVFVVPGQAPVTIEMMGIAHRLRREFPPDQLRDCANQLRVKFRNGTLKLKKRGMENYFPVYDSAVEVESEELPASLRGRFQRVFIQTDPSTGDEQVIFALDPERGIISDNERNVREFHFYSIADGIEAYYDLR